MWLWLKGAGIAVAKWFKNWFVKVDGKDIIPVRIGRWFKSLFVSTNNQPPQLVVLYQKDGTKSVLSSLLCVGAGIAIGLILLILVALFSKDLQANNVFRGFFILISGVFYTGNAANMSVGFDAFQLGNYLTRVTPLILTGLSVAIAFKTGLFNIGAPGQYLMGTMASLLVAMSIPATTATAQFFVWLLALVVGVVAGMLWGCIPGAFKALLNVNEVIVCIMTNWIAGNIVTWVFSGSQFVNPKSPGFLYKTNHFGIQNPRLGMDLLFPGSWADGGIVIAIVVAVMVWVMLNKTTFGFELKACGSNRHASKYAGMNDRRNIILSMAIAGGLSALGGALYFMNGQTEFQFSTTYQTLPSVGFNGIPVALLASSHPLGVVFSAAYIAFLEVAGTKVSSFADYNEYISDLIVAVIIYFAGFSKLIKDLPRRRSKW